MCIILSSITESSLQRYNFARDVKAAKNTVIYNSLAMTTCLLMTCVSGYYPVLSLNNCKDVNEKTVLVDYIRNSSFPQGLIGLFTSAILVSTVSTLSSLLIGLENMVARAVTGSEFKFEYEYKTVCFTFGCLMTLLAAGIGRLRESYKVGIIQLGVLGQSFLYTPVVCVVIIGIFTDGELDQAEMLVAFLVSELVNFIVMVFSIVPEYGMS